MTSKKEPFISLSKVVKKNVTLSEESIIDEQAQIEIKDDKTINEDNEIEDSNDQNCDNTHTEDCNKKYE